MSQYLTVWGDNSNGQLNIPNRIGSIVGLNSNLISGAQNTQYFSLGARHGLVSTSGTRIYNKPLVNQDNVITGYRQIRVPVITPWGDNSFFQLNIQKGNFFYEKYDAGIDTTYIIDLQFGLIHGYGYDLIFSDVSNATGEIVNWTQADFFNNGILPQNLLRYPRGFLDVKAGDGYVLALDKNNKITGWGNSGNPVISGKFFYEDLNQFFPANIKEIAAGQSHALVLFDNGQVTGWGDNSLNQLNFDDSYLFSGVKISTKANHSLAMGLKTPMIVSIQKADDLGLDDWAINYKGTGNNITGLEFQYSLDRNNWQSIISSVTGEGVEDNFLFFNNLPSGDNNYYARLVEHEDTFCENTGWKQIPVSTVNIGFRGIDMSSDGQHQTFIGVSGVRAYPFISNNYGNTWTQITGVTGSFFWNDYGFTNVKLSSGGNLQLVAGPRSAQFSGPYQIFLSQNYGNTWSLLTGNTSNLSHLDASDDFKVIAVPKLRNNFISISHDSGVTWFDASGAGSRVNWRQISLSSDGQYMLAAVNETNQALFKSSDSGVSWTSTSGILSGGFNTVKISKNGQIQLAENTSNGSLYISYDYGNNWRTAIEADVAWLFIDMSDDGEYILATVNQNNLIYRSKNSGISWNEVDLTPFYGQKPPIGPISISSNGEYQSMVNKTISAGQLIYTNCNFGEYATSGNIQNTGSTTIYNPAINKFDLWTDYRVFGWGQNGESIAQIPSELQNERIIDIAAGYENNMVLTENPIAVEEVRVGPLQNEFILSRVIVLGAGFNLLNKTYNPDSTLNDRILYRYFSGTASTLPTPTNLTVFWDNTQWGIYSGLNLIYYNPDDVLYPWLSQNWLIAPEYVDNFSFMPAPTGVFEFKDPDPIIPPCSGFIFDTGVDLIFELRLQSFNITSNSFEVKWNKVIDADSYRLDVATDSGFNNFINGYQNKTLPTGQNSDIITGLNPSTTYYATIKAINDEEIFVSSTILEQQTRISAPTGLFATNITSINFRLNWTQVSGANSYGIDVSTDPSFLTNFIPGYRNRIVKNTMELIIGLNPSTTYYSRVRAINTFGPSINSQVLTQTTDSGPPKIPF